MTPLERQLRAMAEELKTRFKSERGLADSTVDHYKHGVYFFLDHAFGHELHGYQLPVEDVDVAA